MTSHNLNYHYTTVEFFRNLGKLHPSGKYVMTETGESKWFTLQVDTKSVAGREDIIEFDFSWFLASGGDISNFEMQELINTFNYGEGE